jgi:hypothetical protein
MTQSNSEFCPPQPRLLHTELEIQGSKIKWVPRFTPRILPDEGSQRFAGPVVGVVVLKMFSPVLEKMSLSTPGIQAIVEGIEARRGRRGRRYFIVAQYVGIPSLTPGDEVLLIASGVSFRGLLLLERAGKLPVPPQSAP